MRLILLLFYLSLYGCVSEKNIQQIYTGDFIEKKFKKIQYFDTDFEVENGGPILDNKIKIYKDNAEFKCILVSRIHGDSGVYGTEIIIYFSGFKTVNGYKINFNYNFVDGEGSPKTEGLNYLGPLVYLDKKEIDQYLNTYRSEFSKDTLKECL